MALRKNEKSDGMGWDGDGVPADPETPLRMPSLAVALVMSLGHICLQNTFNVVAGVAVW